MPSQAPNDAGLTGAVVPQLGWRSVKPYEDPAEFVIEDLTDEEWDRFVAALDE